MPEMRLLLASAKAFEQTRVNGDRFVVPLAKNQKRTLGVTPK
jgi:hypothetical protein